MCVALQRSVVRFARSNSYRHTFMTTHMGLLDACMQIKRAAELGIPIVPIMHKALRGVNPFSLASEAMLDTSGHLLFKVGASVYECGRACVGFTSHSNQYAGSSGSRGVTGLWCIMEFSFQIFCYLRVIWNLKDRNHTLIFSFYALLSPAEHRGVQYLVSKSLMQYIPCLGAGE